MKHITIAEFDRRYKGFAGRVYLYGASVTGHAILQLLENSSVKVEGFIDGDSSKYSELFYGYRVVPPQEVPQDACVVITTSPNAAIHIDKMLTETYGISEIYYFQLESIIVKHLFFIKGYDVSKTEKYEAEYQELAEKYDSIVVYPMWADRMGEFVGRYMIMYQEMRDRGDQNYHIMLPYVRPSNDIPLCNARLMDMISRQSLMIYGEREEFWAYVCRKHITELVLDGTYIHTLEAYDAMAELQWEKALRFPKGTQPVVKFSKEEEEEAKERAERLGIKEPFVCVFARDSSYLNQRKGNWSYHDYRDSDINNFIPLVNYLKGKDIQVVRVGTVTTGKLEDDNVVDVTNDNYDELLDLYVNAKCSCWIGGVSGAEYISGLFRKKKLSVNAMLIDSYDITPYCVGLSWYIPKLYYSLKEERYLSLKEMFWLDLAGDPPHLYKEKYHVDIIENTAEDILDLYIECEQKEAGTWEYTKDEEVLVEKYQMVLSDIRKEYSDGWLDYAGAPIKNHIPDMPIGSSFLKKYENFLLSEYNDKKH